jgi:hypothetical protein
MMNNKHNLVMDPEMAFHLPLFEKDGASFMSKDARGQMCTVNGTAWRVEGRYFNGTDNFINLNNTFSSVCSSARKTIIARAIPAKTDYLTEGRILTLHRTAANTSFAFLALGNPATWRAAYVTGSTTLVKLDSGVPLVTGQPAFLALVQDGSSIRFLVNNIKVTASNGSIPSMDNPAAAYIGAYYNNGTPTNFFQGTISEAYIFSRALSSMELERIRLR